MAVSIRSKLFLGFLAVASLAATSGFFGLRASHQIVGYFEGGESHFRSNVAAATEAASYVKRLESHLIMYLVLHDTADRQKVFARYKSLSEKLDLLDAQVENPEAQRLLEAIRLKCEVVLRLSKSLIINHDEELDEKSEFIMARHSVELRNLNDAIDNVAENSLRIAYIETNFLNKQESITAATALSNYSKKAESSLLMFLSLGAEEDREKFYRYNKTLKENIDLLDERVKDPAAREMLDRILGAEREMFLYGRQLVESRDARGDDGPFDYHQDAHLLHNFHLMASQIRALGVDLANQEVSLESQVKALAIERAENTTYMIFLVMVAVVLLALSLGYLISHSLSRRLEKLKNAVVNIGRGHLKTEILVEKKDEIGGLAGAINLMARDLHHTLVSRRYVENIINSMMDMLLVFSPDLSIQVVNRSTLHLLGFNEDELLGHSIVEVVGTGFSEMISTNLFRAGFVSNIELNFRCKNGESIPVLFSASVMRDADRSIQGVVCAARDITEVKRGEQERARLQAQLIQAQKMETIGTLAGGIAHDFNNILTPILGFSEICRGELDPQSRACQCLDHVINSARRAKNLVQQVLTFSRQTEDKRRPLALEQVVAEAVSLLQASLPKKVGIRQKLMPGLPLVMADPTQIHQILMNLGANALQAMPDEAGEVEVELDQVEADRELLDSVSGMKPGTYLRLRVRDNGQGMPPETLKRIFEPFFTTKDIGKGTGLGLSVVHGIVTSHGGHILVESEVGKGSVFTILLPAVMAPQTALLSADTHHEPAGEGHILLVDDEEIVLLLIREMLEPLGYRVSAFCSPEEALTAFGLEPQSFDLVITDLSMPIKSGLDVARRMKQVRSDVPIILLTGFVGTVSREESASAGIRDFVMKPVVAKELTGVVRRILESGEPEAMRA